MIFQFRIGEQSFQFEAGNFLDAMEMCNRQVVDAMGIGACAWYDSCEPNSYYLGLGNNFD